jgi:gamma-glutamylcysteine synthetase
MAPVAFWTGLLTTDDTRDKALNMVEKWSNQERTSWNKSALNLDSSQIGPNGKSFEYWNKWAGELALEGLAEREKNEESNFEHFFESVLSEGPFSLQVQNDFADREIILKYYLNEQ